MVLLGNFGVYGLMPPAGPCLGYIPLLSFVFFFHLLHLCSDKTHTYRYFNALFHQLYFFFFAGDYTYTNKGIGLKKRGDFLYIHIFLWINHYGIQRFPFLIFFLQLFSGYFERKKCSFEFSLSSLLSPLLLLSKAAVKMRSRFPLAALPLLPVSQALFRGLPVPKGQ